MAQPYIGEIRMFAGTFAPAGWMLCSGATLPISENEALFQLIGTTYGGDGESTFNLPDLRGRIPLHQGNGSIIGQMDGVEEVTLDNNQIPSHSHAMLASGDIANSPSPINAILGKSTQISTFLASNTTPTLQMDGTSVLPTGSNQPHMNLQPYLCVNFIISLFGIFPSPF